MVLSFAAEERILAAFSVSHRIPIGMKHPVEAFLVARNRDDPSNLLRSTPPRLSASAQQWTH